MRCVLLHINIIIIILNINCMPCFFSYDCHINVEACGSVRAIKYLYKYVYKGPDRAMVKLVVANEEKTDVNADEIKVRNTALH